MRRPRSVHGAAIVATLAAFAAAAPAGCSESTAEVTSGGGGEGAATASVGAGGAGGSDPCDATGVSKGPWVQRIDGETARIRWEACRVDGDTSVVFAPEAGGAERTGTGTQSKYVVTNSFSAPLNPLAPPDLAGTYWLHEVDLAGLAAGTCYTYHLAADGGRAGRFCAARPSGEPLRFMAIGDTNPGLGGASAGILAHILPMGPELTLHGGDIEYYESGLDTWNYWFSVLQPMLARGPFYPAIGNHESENPDEYAQFALRYFGDAGFGGDSTHYTFETAGVHFFCLDTEESIYPGDLQGTWLTKELEKATQAPGFRFSVVYFHRPIVTCGDTGDDPTGRALLEPLFLEYKVPLVLQAHMHGYERFDFGDITYITTAGGGGLLGDVDENVARDYCGDRVASGPYHHGMLFDVGPGAISGQAIDEDGAVLDAFSIAVP